MDISPKLANKFIDDYNNIIHINKIEGDKKYKDFLSSIKIKESGIIRNFLNFTYIKYHYPY